MVMERGYAKLRRKWRSGDFVELEFPMPIRRVAADERVKADAGKVALQRGPIVFCAEGIDNSGRVLNLALTDEEKLSHWFRSDLLGGVEFITGKATVADPGSAGRPASKRRQSFMAVPYYAWANRGAGEMAVWLPRTSQFR